MGLLSNRRRVLRDVQKTHYDFVDLNLSVDWCTCNIGATKPEEYGWYFQWAGTIPYNSDRTPVEGGDAINFNFNENCPYFASGWSTSSSKWYKYTSIDNYSSTGVADNKLILEPEDDAAHVYIGGDCRMPTRNEYMELMNACNKTWVENYNGTGINGCLFTLKSDSTKTLFFPSAGFLYGTEWRNVGSGSYYWMSSLYNNYPYQGTTLLSYNDYCNSNSSIRFYGQSVRAVKPRK